jgi:uncharacterized membrane protein
MDGAALGKLNTSHSRALIAKTGDRFWEVDALRGMAVVMMVAYHLLYDLYYFGITDPWFEDTGALCAINLPTPSTHFVDGVTDRILGMENSAPGYLG